MSNPSSSATLGIKIYHKPRGTQYAFPLSDEDIISNFLRHCIQKVLQTLAHGAIRMRYAELLQQCYFGYGSRITMQTAVNRVNEIFSFETIPFPRLIIDDSQEPGEYAYTKNVEPWDFYINGLWMNDIRFMDPNDDEWQRALFHWITTILHELAHFMWRASHVSLDRPDIAATVEGLWTPVAVQARGEPPIYNADGAGPYGESGQWIEANIWADGAGKPVIEDWPNLCHIGRIWWLDRSIARETGGICKRLSMAAIRRYVSLDNRPIQDVWPIEFLADTRPADTFRYMPNDRHFTLVPLAYMYTVDENSGHGRSGGSVT